MDFVFLDRGGGCLPRICSSILGEVADEKEIGSYFEFSHRDNRADSLFYSWRWLAGFRHAFRRGGKTVKKVWPRMLEIATCLLVGVFLIVIAIGFLYLRYQL